MYPPPTGTVTFLFTDIEGSTRLAQAHPAEWESARQRHHAILRAAVEAHQGYVFKIIGDAFCVAFPTASDGLQAALAAQRALQAEVWGETPIRVRMGLHTGAAEAHDCDYQGYLTLAHVQRVMSAAYGGQTLISTATTGLLCGQLPGGVTLRDMGEHRLEGLLNPERLWQVGAPGLPADFPPLKTLAAVPNNLPVQLTSFVGREKEVAEVKHLIGAVRLLTLTGPGGTGKTRLALQVATDVLDAFRDGVWFVDLALIADPALVPQTIAPAFALSEAPGKSIREALKDYLRDKELLLVLDNFEQVVEAASLVKELLTSAPKVKFIVTSRTLLRIAGEHEYAVPVLSLPGPDDQFVVERLLGCEAVRLFADRAQAVKSDFVVDDENAASVAEICSRLDGLPLAIELAAARVRALPPEKIVTQLANRLKFLTSVARDIPVRQQTLRNAIDWSYDLLTPQDQILFRRMSVFAGGCVLEAADAICSAASDIDVLNGLESLIDKSLLRQSVSEGEPRFAMLETIREYAREKLRESEEEKQTRDRHLWHFMQVAEEFARQLGTEQHFKSLTRLEAENDNMRAALEWSLQAAGGPAVDCGPRIACALAEFWEIRGAVGEGRMWLERLLENSGRSSAQVRARALRQAGRIAGAQGDRSRQRTLMEMSLALSRDVGDKSGTAYALVGLAYEAWSRGMSAEHVKSLCDESLDIFRELGDRFGIAESLGLLANAAGRSLDYTQAEALLREALAAYRALGNQQGVAWTLSNLGRNYGWQGDFARARELLKQSLALFRSLEAKGAIANALKRLGEVEFADGQYARARIQLEAGMAIDREFGPNAGVQYYRRILAYVHCIQGEYARADELFRGSLRYHMEVDNSPIAASLAGFGALRRAQGELKVAASLCGKVTSMLGSKGRQLRPIELEQFDHTVASLRAQLPRSDYDAAWVEGQALTLEQAIALALGDDGM